MGGSFSEVPWSPDYDGLMSDDVVWIPDYDDSNHDDMMRRYSPPAEPIPAFPELHEPMFPLGFPRAMSPVANPSAYHWTPRQAESSTQVFEIPATIASDHQTNALGDFCAKRNFMKTAHALLLGLRIDWEDICTIRVGSGKQIKTSGSVVTSFRFRYEFKKYTLKFDLLPDCVHDVILGKSFLKATKTFSSLANCASRVVKRIIMGLKSFRCLYLGDAAPMFKGFVNGVEQQALADSGSKVLIMDEGYAESFGLPITRTSETRIKLRFADNTVAKTSGMTHGVRWRFGNGLDGEEYSLDFHVLKNAPAAVILSDEFLFGVNAFAEYDCYLTDDGDEDEEAYLFAIDIDNSDLGLGRDVSYKDAAQHSEIVRRGEEKDRIDNLPFTQRPEARLVEEDRRAEWDAQQRHNLSFPPIQTSSNANSGQSGNSVSSYRRRKSRWLLKLKLKRKP
ncbi:hypothetical protein HBI56_105480 [Parastagonospora nodorum]|nr:hypothetical protein HBI10_164320 [Parastagonospora nodorum]KAH4021651.1 hypothetical protein HBI13_105550 [Parastagonospora nodorum]KAH4030400.1 hypothetical protein HBI09_129040 [Parastagonospora nodorum]KAH4048358.1 hypothetical protein HBH49_157600 [Parastagonospora nodorum]KAH4105318.1 hypothetical protein HBH46_088410 [Parastagonospora nodorum]